MKLALFALVLFCFVASSWSFSCTGFCNAAAILYNTTVYNLCESDCGCVASGADCSSCCGNNTLCTQSCNDIHNIGIQTTPNCDALCQFFGSYHIISDQAVCVKDCECSLQNSCSYCCGDFQECLVGCKIGCETYTCSNPDNANDCSGVTYSMLGMLLGAAVML